MHPDFNSTLWNGAPIGFPYITVTGTQTRYPITFRYAAESDPGPYPIPLNAPIEGGSASKGDRHVLAIDTTNCKLYEVYDGHPGANSWTAGSGAVFNLRSNALRPANWTSADAAGLSVLAGLVRYEEVAAGEIRHAIRVTAPYTRNQYVWPARHHASGLTDARYPAMGQRFRLKADYDISSFPADVQVILRAMKKYGVILADNGAPWFISGVPDSRWNNTNVMTLRRVLGHAFEAVDVSSLMIDPNSGQARTPGVLVSVNPTSTSVGVGTTRQFSATVHSSTDQSVTWSVNGVVGGNATVGYINASGLYSAPSTIPSPAVVQVQARSRILTTAVASAATTITPYVAPTGSATFVRADTSTAGSWKGVYGSEGFVVLNETPKYPSYVTVTPSGHSSFTWRASTTDLRGLQKSAATANDRIAACWYSGSFINLALAFNDQNTHQVAMYMVDWDSTSRSQKVEVLDANNNVLDTRTVAGFNGGQYLVWNLSGRVTIRLSNTNSVNAVLSGLFFGSGTQQPTPGAAATFVKTDTTTQGTWKGVYGTEGFHIINDVANYPSYVRMTPSGHSSATWVTTTPDVRAPQKGGPTGRIASCWYSATSVNLTFDFTDQNFHQVALYLLDWDSLNRSTKVEVLDSSNRVLDTRSVSGFSKGQYLVWNLKGRVIIRLTNVNTRNAIVNAVFFR